jgi:hypothetical protein
MPEMARMAKMRTKYYSDEHDGDYRRIEREGRPPGTRSMAARI